MNAAVQAEKEKNATALKDFFANVGMKNTITGKPITTMEEFEAWQKELNTQQLNKDLKAGKLTAEQLEQVISNHPAVKQAQRVIQQTEQAQTQQREAADQQRIDNELAEIGKLNPGIKGVSDLLNMPKAEEFRGYVAKGYSFLDAYKLTHMEELTAAKAEAAKQQALNNARGKDHLNATGNSRGNGAVAVPAAVMASYRAFNPKATDAEIQAHYNKYKKT